MSVLRNISVRWPKEGSAFQFRMDFFTVLNHPQFANRNIIFVSSSFGIISSTGVNPRIGQLGIKLLF
jgi:hypothetical protein